MTEETARHLVVGRLRKPHGLKGDCTVFPLTSNPAVVFRAGRSVWLMNLKGEVVGGPLKIERSRAYHREWLLAFRGYLSRDALTSWHDLLLSAPADTLPPPEEGEVYLHELEGFAIQDQTGAGLGIVTKIDETITGVLLEVQGVKREYILPFKKEYVTEVDRPGRRLIVDLPDGFTDV